MREFMQTIEEIRKLENIRASFTLQKRIQGLSFALPKKHEGVFMPLIVFRGALVLGALLILCILGGSGLVMAATLSKPGSTFYPVKQALQKAHIPFISAEIEKKENPPSPTPTPSQHVQIQISIAPTQGKHLDENDEKKSLEETDAHQDSIKPTSQILRDTEKGEIKNEDKKNDHNGSDTHASQNLEDDIHISF